VRLRSPTTVLLLRARVIFTLTALIPTMLMTALGIIFLAEGGSKYMAIAGGILVLAFCAVALVGYAVGTMFVTRGAGLAAVQNEFLASVSHELRTPLTSIRMFIDTLRTGRLGEAEQQRCLNVTAQELVRLDGLVDKLIHLSKLESHHAVFERRDVAVADIIADALAAFDTVNLTDKVDLRVKVDPGLMVRGDRAALAQAVGNLLGNAWKYTPAEGKRITVSAAVADLKHVVIAVEDNGSGVAKPEERRIFEKFQRGKAADDSGSAGSGLGLAIVRAIVRAHRGQVDVRGNTPTGGASFRITLPMVRQAA
jgi:two-component system phosphate regulon sensor histidine kinase PhoR